MASDPLYKAPTVGGGAGTAVDATGLSGALGAGGVTPGAGGGAPAMGTSFNLPSYDTLAATWGAANAGPNQAAQNQIGNLYNQAGLVNAQAGVQKNQMIQDTARDRTRLGMQQSSLADQLGAADKTAADINYNADRQIQNFMGGQAARGATHTEGTTRTLGDFQRGRWRGIENLNLDRAQLARAAKNLGMQDEELGIRLDRSIEQLGLSASLQAQDILQAINDVEAGRFNPLSSLLGQVYALSGIRPVAGSEGPAPVTTGGGGSSRRVM